MLQRIQSVFLLLAVVINLSLLAAPLWQYQTHTETETLSGLSTQATLADASHVAAGIGTYGEPMKAAAHITLITLTLLTSAWLVYVIFQYQNRVRQKQLVYGAIAGIFLEVMSLVWLTMQSPAFIMGSADNGRPQWGFALPVTAILFAWLAIGRIQHDEDLVRSSNRVR